MEIQPRANHEESSVAIAQACAALWAVGREQAARAALESGSALEARAADERWEHLGAAPPTAIFALVRALGASVGGRTQSEEAGDSIEGTLAAFESVVRSERRAQAARVAAAGCIALAWGIVEGIEPQENPRNSAEPSAPSRDEGAEDAQELVRRLGALSSAIDQELSGASEAPLFAAAEMGCAQTVKARLARGDGAEALRFTNGLTPLMAAARHGHASCVELLLPHSDPNARNSGGRTAAGIAIEARKWDCAMLLIGATDARATDPMGRTLLMLAAEHGEAPLGVFRALCAGGDVHEPNANNGFTPLMRYFARATRTGAAMARGPGEAAQIAALLAGDGASLNATTSLGETALIFAVCNGREASEYEALLPKMDADALGAGRDGQKLSALEFAVQGGALAAVRALSRFKNPAALAHALREALCSRVDTDGLIAVELANALSWEKAQPIVIERMKEAQAKPRFWARWEMRALEGELKAPRAKALPPGEKTRPEASVGSKPSRRL